MSGASIVKVGIILGAPGLSSWAKSAGMLKFFGIIKEGDAASVMVPNAEIISNNPANNAADALRFKTILTLQEAGILDQAGSKVSKVSDLLLILAVMKFVDIRSDTMLMTPCIRSDTMLSEE